MRKIIFAMMIVNFFACIGCTQKSLTDSKNLWTMDKQFTPPTETFAYKTQKINLKKNAPPIRTAFLASNLQNIHPSRFNIHVDNYAAKEFFFKLAASSAYPINVPENLPGKITVHLKNVTTQEALEIVKQLYGYQYKEAKNKIEILPPPYEHTIFFSNHLDHSIPLQLQPNHPTLHPNELFKNRMITTKQYHFFDTAEE